MADIDITELIWDEQNISHVAKHGVAQEDVEQVCQTNPLVEKMKNGRLFLTGPTKSGRMLVVILAPKVGGAFYPVTARSADRRERRIYAEKKGGGEDS